MPKRRARHLVSLATAAVVAIGTALAITTAAQGTAEPAPHLKPGPHDTIARPFISGIGSAPEKGEPIPVPEGPAFTLDGDLVFVSAFGDDQGNKVFKVDLRTKDVTPLYADDTSVFTSLDIHPDGRFFLADYLGGPAGAGRIVTMEPDGTNAKTLVDDFKGTPIYPDDLVFDGHGGFYYTDMQGNTLEPTGRVIHVSKSGEQTLLADGLAFPNGIGLSPDGKRLWVNEHLANRLLAFDLNESGEIAETSPGTGVSVYGHFSGGLVDSITVDADGNVYQGVIEGARAEIVDHHGNPVATVRPAGRTALETYPNTTSVAIKPGSRRGFLLAGGPDGISVLAFRAPAPGKTPFS